MAIDWNDIATKVNTIIQDGAPVAELLLPAWAPAISVAAKVLQGAAAAEPTAVALVQSIQSGTPPTAAQLQSFSTAYESAYQTLQTDIAKQIAAS
jgi:hypothetical protein